MTSGSPPSARCFASSPACRSTSRIEGDSTRHCTRPRCWRWSCCAPRAWTWWSSRSTKPRSTHFTPPRRGFPWRPGWGAWRATSSVAGHRAKGSRRSRCRSSSRSARTTLDVATPELVSRAHADGYAVHVWLDESEEDEATYARVLDMCADALMTAYPSRFERFLRLRRPPRPAKAGATTAAGSTPACTLRPTAIERRGRVVRVARLDRRGEPATAGSSCRGPDDARRRSVHATGPRVHDGGARETSRQGRRLLRQRAITLTAIATARGDRLAVETFSIDRGG